MRENEEEAQIDRLPVDLLAHIFFLLSSFRDLAQASGVSRKWRQGVKRSLGRREKLSFAGMKMDDDSTSRLVQDAYCLKELDISRSCWGSQITDNGLYKISLAKCVSNLTSISLWGMTGITDKGVIQLVSRAISLQNLNVGGTFITDDSLVAIANNCPQLKCSGFFERDASVFSQGRACIKQPVWHRLGEEACDKGIAGKFCALISSKQDTCNKKSNQQNLGTIKSSNLCTEIIEFTSPTETAVCNLASIALPRYVREKGAPVESHPSKMVGNRGSRNRYFDFDKLAEVTAIVTSNLNKIIDVNYYPVETAKTSNMRHRPIGIGVQGLADTFILLGMSFESPEAQQLNKDIFETIYYHALKASSELAAKEGPYETYHGSPVSKGILQPDMWGVTPSYRWDWAALRKMISENGVRNSLLVAPMPTASTSQILGNNECFEPYTSNIYSRRVLSGEFIVVNKHLLHDLTELGLWSPALKNKIIYNDGSVQKIPEIPEDLKSVYKTVWEIKQRTLVDMAVDRGC